MASERVYFCFGDDDCKFETLNKEQIIAAIAEATGNTVTDVDSAFITKVKEQNKNAELKFWVGTVAEYNALETKDESCLYILTNDTTLDDINAKITDLSEDVYALIDGTIIAAKASDCKTVNGVSIASANEDVTGRYLVDGSYYMGAYKPLTNALINLTVASGSNTTTVTAYNYPDGTQLEDLENRVYDLYTYITPNTMNCFRLMLTGNVDNSPYLSQVKYCEHNKVWLGLKAVMSDGHAQLQVLLKDADHEISRCMLFGLIETNIKIRTNV